MSLNRTEDAALHEYIMKWVTPRSRDLKTFQQLPSRWVTVSADHIVILILLLALVVKFVFFENKEELAEQLRAHISTETAPSENKNRLFTMPLIRTTFFLSDNPKEEDGSLSRSKVEPFSPKHFRCRTRRQRSPNGLGQITLWKIVKGKQRHVRENVQECGGMSENIQRFEFRRVGLEWWWSYFAREKQTHSWIPNWEGRRRPRTRGRHQEEDSFCWRETLRRAQRFAVQGLRLR